MSDSELNSSMSVNNRLSETLLQECRICGAPARYSSFGVISCFPCKMFFKRNGNIGQITFKCDLNGECEININNRHVCPACRLAKCLKCGMNTDQFRSSREIKPKANALIKIQVQHQPKRLPTLNLLQSDQSLLTTSEWKLLSNLYTAYKESPLLSIGQRLIDTQDVLPFTYVTYQALVEEFLVSIYETTGIYFRFNDDLFKLPSDDRSILLRHAADNVACLSCAFIMDHCRLLFLDAFSNAMRTKYGKHTVDLHLWARRFIDQDMVLIKLAISLFAVTGTTCLYSANISGHSMNSITILEIQNKYAEVTWKYLIYKYSYHEAVKRFANMISWFLAITTFMVHAQNLRLHVEDINLLVEQTEMALLLDDVDRIVETNK